MNEIIEGLFVRLGLDSKDMEKGLSRVNSKSEDLTRSFKKVSIAAGAVTAAFGLMVRNILKTDDQVQKMATSLGMATKEFTRLAYAAEQNGVSVEVLNRAFVNLNKNLSLYATGNRTAMTAIKALGIEVRGQDGSMRRSEDIMMDIADAIGSISSPAERSAIAMQLFGMRAGPQLLPMLLSGADGIQALKDEADRLGISFDELTGKRIEEFNDAMNSFKESINGAVREILTNMLPALTKITKWFRDLPNDVKSGSIIIVTALASITLAVGALGTALSVLAAHPVMALLLGTVAVGAGLYLAIRRITNAIKGAMGDASENLKADIQFMLDDRGRVTGSVEPRPTLSVADRAETGLSSFSVGAIVGGLGASVGALVKSIVSMNKFLDLVNKHGRTGKSALWNVGIIDRARIAGSRAVADAGGLGQFARNAGRVGVRAGGVAAVAGIAAGEISNYFEQRSWEAAQSEKVNSVIERLNSGAITATQALSELKTELSSIENMIARADPSVPQRNIDKATKELDTYRNAIRELELTIDEGKINQFYGRMADAWSAAADNLQRSITVPFDKESIESELARLNKVIEDNILNISPITDDEVAATRQRISELESIMSAFRAREQREWEAYQRELISTTKPVPDMPGFTPNYRLTSPIVAKPTIPVEEIPMERGAFAGPGINEMYAVLDEITNKINRDLNTALMQTINSIVVLGREMGNTLDNAISGWSMWTREAGEAEYVTRRVNGELQTFRQYTDPQERWNPLKGLIQGLKEAQKEMANLLARTIVVQTALFVLNSLLSPASAFTSIGNAVEWGVNKIFGFASGGIPMTPMLATVAERGPEIIMPLDKAPGMVSKMAEKMGTTTNNNQPINVSVTLDGDVLTRAVAKRLPYQVARY